MSFKDSETKKAYEREYYRNNRDKRQAKIARAKERRSELRKFIFDFLLMHPCVDCGETDPIVLEFDHQRDKLKEVKQAVTNGWSKEKILIEIDKCEVRCANCHRRKTFREYHQDVV